MNPWFRRTGTLLALLAIFAFTVHSQAERHYSDNPQGDHCCVCHTAGMAAAPVAAAYQPPLRFSSPLPLLGQRPLAHSTCFADRWRGPPCA